MKQFYAGKTILITGATGFVGKVVLEKLVRKIPDFKKIYVMIRAKKNMSLEQRFDKQILSSEIFDPLFAKNPALKSKLKQKVVPIAGDLIIDKLGLSEGDRRMITSEADVIINCAASVSFDDPLLDAIEINFFGCQRMLQLALECSRLRCFTHVSTAYVNCNILGNAKIEEKVYAGEQDPEKVVADILRLGP